MFNKYKFEEVYGVALGTRGTIMKYPDPVNNEFEMDFTTPNHSEEDVRFEIDTMAFLFFRNIMKLEVWDGDEKLYESNRSISMFVSDDGKDPLAELPTGDKRIPRIPRTTWLKPNHTYTFKAYRTVGPSPKNPIGIQYYATDHNEVSYEGNTAAVPPVPEPEFPGELGRVPMTFGGITGMFVPD